MLNKNLIGIITNYIGFQKGINFEIPFYLPTGRKDREKHLDKLNWYSLSGNTNIPYQFFEKHISSCEQRGVPDKVDWPSLSGNTNIPVTFFEKHISSCEQLGVPDKVNWSCLSGNTNIPITFFLPTGREDREKHLELQSKEMNIKVDWSELSGNTNIPKHYNLIKLKEILYICFNE